MEKLAARDVEMRALTLRPESGLAAAREQIFGGEVRRFRAFEGLRVRDIMLSLRAGWWLLVRSDWDLLHCSGFSYFAVLPLLVAKLKGKPVLVKTTLLGENGAFNPGDSWIARKVLAIIAHADVIVALSQGLEDDLRSRKPVKSRILQIPNGVDTELFRPAREKEQERARRAFGLPLAATVIVSAGMLCPRKNLIALVRAAAGMQRRPVCVLMAGPPGPDEDCLRELDEAIAALPEGVEVRLLGLLAADQLAELLRAADIFALMSRAEGLPNALLEGMSTALACVASDIPGSADVLAKGGGRLVPLDDEAHLVSVLDRLVKDPAERCRLGAEARKLVLERYSFSGIADRYRAVYDDMLAGEASS
jgi:glycosyltransferase involved in cell wall biosynthesis